MSQRKNLESNESSKSEYENAINEKDEEIASQTEIIKCCKETLYDGLGKKLTKENMFRIEPKKSGKKGNTTSSTTVDSLKCEFAECGIDNVDLIKCNVCVKWVCEDCNDVPVAKLKSIIIKFQTVYFICKACVRNHATENGDGITLGYCEKDEMPKAGYNDRKHQFTKISTIHARQQSFSN